MSDAANTAALARRLLGMLDLTTLNDGDTGQVVRTLAASAATPVGRVAALCTWARLIGDALDSLGGTGVPVAAVANFPAGEADVQAAAAECTQALAAGASELDVVFPWRALLAGDRKTPLALVRACREACGERARLKVILESGQLASAARIREAADIAIAGGAHFLKTSTGRTQPGATLLAAQVMLDAIAQARTRAEPVGFKASGGIRTLADAASYLRLYEQRFGAGSAVASVFRIGASQLVHELLAVGAGTTVNNPSAAADTY
ncbi:MAG TPA: deoxyribose-phosphate aldolase [Steroidobacteraceae bacterium]|jgi:deoxyribose-phosphate aldolase|nr:deoxyribose-phosphate aldolase [Steroidobacteraceae bacterium]